MNKDLTNKSVNGFSRLTKEGKLNWVVDNFFDRPKEGIDELMDFWLSDEDQQKVLDHLSENAISNFVLPYSVAPNFLIDGKIYAVPMVIEESSVVAAASKAAKYWSTRGGFHTEIIDTVKEGCIYFTWDGPFQDIKDHLSEIAAEIRLQTAHLTANMESRGGGILNIDVVDMEAAQADFGRINMYFNTCESMGANFINTILERGAEVLKEWAVKFNGVRQTDYSLEIIMSILTNYTPQCCVRTWVQCPVEDLTHIDGMSAEAFATKFEKAVRFAQIDVGRATTHNKGIYNGIDAVLMATGNDYRAIEACGHAYASRDGVYRSLSSCTIRDGIFLFEMTMPLAVGTVGGLTSLHPLAKRSLEMLGYPSANELMSIIASTGLAQNFGAVKSLVTTGLQKGHMKMHLQNMLLQLNANEQENTLVTTHFKDKTISFAEVRAYLEDLRGNASTQPE